jgi:hypothetical protein
VALLQFIVMPRTRRPSPGPHPSPSPHARLGDSAITRVDHDADGAKVLPAARTVEHWHGTALHPIHGVKERLTCRRNYGVRAG